ncbi:alpha/beta fold hydrolase [Erythrobacter crassostreae]|uniref:palmitoyl-protein hydrolase n=1 Tax=Erythrobacter crassostreae TaxID=2828328 RepID=A0A9X1JMG8_9SPHN|nr:alpha/beta hydrolase [Erythrobacter crassostrea]MBV7258713.1 alpha/beta hydrolase [Erythrobacter crassostrea]
MSNVQFHEMPEQRKIAYRLTKGTGPALVFLPGYMSDMDGGKATSLFAEAEAQGRACLLLDYSGCGESSGDFADGTLSRWREEVLELIAAYTDGPVLLIGSSMGGWLMLLVAEALGDRLAGVIGIAAAPDFIRWGYSDEQRATLAGGEIVYEENPYGPEPTPTHPGFYTDAEGLIRLDRTVAIDCPVRLLHGQRDTDVPFEISLKLAEALRSDAVQVTLIKDGDHRLSRASDIALLKTVVSSFY